MTRKVLVKIEYVVYPEDDSPYEVFDNMKDAVAYAQECGPDSEIAVHTDVEEYPKGESDIYNRSLSTPFVIKVMWASTEPWIVGKIFR